MSSHTREIDALWTDLTKMARLVLAQFRSSLACFHSMDLAQAEEIIERDDVVDNLNVSLEERCFDLVASGGLTEIEQRTLRATAKVIINLERSGDAGTHIAKRVRLMHQEGIKPSHFEFGDVEDIAVRALSEGAQSFLQRDLDLARQACMREPELDACYVARLIELRERMRQNPDEIPYLIACSSVLKYLEKIADYTLNVGEQAIFLVTGRRLKFSQYQQLDRLVGSSVDDGSDFHPYWDGISGAIVVRVGGQVRPAIFKEGSRRKIQEEFEKLEQWQKISTDLTPRVIGSVSAKDRQSLLREFVDGALLSDLYASNIGIDAKLDATQHLLGALDLVWRNTLVATPPRIDYADQIRKRIEDAYALHPNLEAVANLGITVGGRVMNLDELLRAIEPLQPDLAPPFSVWLHGDFNANNVVYHKAQQIKFVDVHRSRLGDYLQDVGVFLVSMERRPDLSDVARAAIEPVNALFRGFAGRFAEDHGDHSFDRRLSLSLARAYLTSSRVIVEPEFADRLFRRGLACLRQTIEGQ